jgi:hypothetical protein
MASPTCVARCDGVGCYTYSSVFKDHGLTGSERGYDRKKGACEGMTSRNNPMDGYARNRKKEVEASQWLLEE